MSESLKLNLGSGKNKLVGYENVDRLFGQEVYPLEYDDGTVDEIRASHVLEHFSHRDVFGVLEHWVSKLKPGGCLKIAVPDLEKIARDYLDGKPINSQGYLYGGQTDENDFHHVGFDLELLRELFITLGLERIGFWEDEASDAHTLEISLNLMAYKPASEVREIEDRVTAVLGAPRFGPTAHFRCIIESLSALRVPTKIVQGCFWHKNVSKALEEEIKAGSDYIFTLDYDTVFSHQDVMEMYRLMKAVPEIDALVSTQSKRQAETPLFGIGEEHNHNGAPVPMMKFNNNITPITTGHFGLTCFKASALDDMSRPWMNDVPADDGTWEDGCIDSDISFWLKWRDEGKKVYLANKVVVGHIETVVTWPGKNFKPVMQYLGDFTRTGIPKEVERL